MIDLLAAAERVKLAVEESDRYIDLTQSELDRLPTYQYTMPTNPKPGFSYKRQYWRIPGEKKRWWRGSNEMLARLAICGFLKKDGNPYNYYGGPLESFWFVYICEQDPSDDKYVLHKSKEARVIS